MPTLPLFRIVKMLEEVPTVRSELATNVEVPSVMVPIFRLPLPVALVKVKPVEETVPPCIVKMPLPDAFVK